MSCVCVYVYTLRWSCSHTLINRGLAGCEYFHLDVPMMMNLHAPQREVSRRLTVLQPVKGRRLSWAVAMERLTIEVSEKLVAESRYAKAQQM